MSENEEERLIDSSSPTPGRYTLKIISAVILIIMIFLFWLISSITDGFTTALIVIVTYPLPAIIVIVLWGAEDLRETLRKERMDIKKRLRREHPEWPDLRIRAEARAIHESAQAWEEVWRRKEEEERDRRNKVMQQHFMDEKRRHR